MKLNQLFHTAPRKLPKTPSQEEQACCRASQLIGNVCTFIELEDIEQETLTALKKIAARDKAKERAKLNTFTARILRPKAKPMVTKTHASKGDRVGQAALNQLLHTPVGELLKRSQQDLRAKREQVLLALRWINGVIAIKQQEEARP